MKIDAVTFTVLRHALEKRYGDAQGLKTHRTTLLVRIDTDAGGDCLEIGGLRRFRPLLA